MSLLYVTLGLERVSLSVLFLEPAAVRGLFGAIAADCHAAPSSCPPPGVVSEYQGADRSLARFHIGEIFLTHDLRHRFADGQQQRLGRSPAPHHPEFHAAAVAVAMPRYLAERFVTLQEPVERSQFGKRLGRERPAHMLANKASEPLAQSPRLIRNFVQFIRHRSRLQLIRLA
jgi:hypothetical protein